MNDQKKGFIFFDMDETLGFFRNYDGSLNEQGFPDGIYLRPGIKNLLAVLKQDFVLSISTAATLKYTHFVLEKAGLKQYFDRIFTRREFVKLENEKEEFNEASPSGFQKQYSILMKYFNLEPSDAKLGMVIGDNDYDISSDTPGLSTLIVDSLYTPIDVILAVIVDYFNQNDMDYSELGINVKQDLKKHPISGLESSCIELEIPQSLYHSELDKINLIYGKKSNFVIRSVSEAQKLRMSKSVYKPMQLRANRFGLM